MADGQHKRDLGFGGGRFAGEDGRIAERDVHHLAGRGAEDGGQGFDVVLDAVGAVAEQRGLLDEQTAPCMAFDPEQGRTAPHVGDEGGGVHGEQRRLALEYSGRHVGGDAKSGCKAIDALPEGFRGVGEQPRHLRGHACVVFQRHVQGIGRFLRVPEKGARYAGEQVGEGVHHREDGGAGKVKAGCKGFDASRGTGGRDVDEPAVCEDTAEVGAERNTQHGGGVGDGGVDVGGCAAEQGRVGEEEGAQFLGRQMQQPHEACDVGMDGFRGGPSEVG